MGSEGGIKDVFDCELWRNGRRLPSRSCNVREVIGKVLCVYRNNTVQGFGNSIDTEGLRLARIIGLCFDQPFFTNFLIKRACYRVFQYALIGTVSFFGDLA